MPSRHPNDDALDPTLFSYNLDDPPLVESWGQGLIVLHNPHAVHPVPHEYFVDAVQAYLGGDLIRFKHPGWHPFSSKTVMLYCGELKKEIAKLVPRQPRFAVGAITKDEFNAAYGFALRDTNPFIEDHGWFADESDSFLGVVLRDKTDDDWGYVVLARDPHFQFRAIETEVSLTTRDRAVAALQVKIAELLASPKRIFSQD